MTVLFVVGSLLIVLAAWCWWEARSGKPAWGTHLGSDGPPTWHASKAETRGLGAAAGTAAMIGMDGGDG